MVWLGSEKNDCASGERKDKVLMRKVSRIPEPESYFVQCLFTYMFIVKDPVMLCAC